MGRAFYPLSLDSILQPKIQELISIFANQILGASGAFGIWFLYFDI